MTQQNSDRSRVPGAGTLAVLALAWLLVMLSSARQAVGGSPDPDPLEVTRAALELPQVISASLIAGLAVGLVAVNLLGRRLRPLVAVGGAGGALTGLAVAAPILLGYDGLPSVLVLSGAVATAATLGGLLAGVPHREVVAAGAAGALGVFLVGLVERAFEGDLRLLFGAGASPESVVTATGWVVLTASLTAGLVAGVLGYLYLRRIGHAQADPGTAGLRWPAYLVAGALPGLLALLAEAVTRLGGAQLFQLVSDASDSDADILSYFHVARFNRALIVVFVGALVAIFLLGRTLKPAAEEPASEEQPAAQTSS